MAETPKVYEQMPQIIATFLPALNEKFKDIEAHCYTSKIDAETAAMQHLESGLNLLVTPKFDNKDENYRTALLDAIDIVDPKVWKVGAKNSDIPHNLRDTQIAKFYGELAGPVGHMIMALKDQIKTDIKRDATAPKDNFLDRLIPDNGPPTIGSRADQQRG